MRLQLLQLLIWANASHCGDAVAAGAGARDEPEEPKYILYRGISIRLHSVPQILLSFPTSTLHCSTLQRTAAPSNPPGEKGGKIDGGATQTE